MLIRFFILYQLTLLVLAEGVIKNHFKNPPVQASTEHSRTTINISAQSSTLLPAILSTIAASTTSTIIPTVPPSSSIALAPTPTTSDVPVVQSTEFATQIIGPTVPPLPTPSVTSISTSLPASVASTPSRNLTRTVPSSASWTTPRPTSSLTNTQNPSNYTTAKKFTTLDTLLVVVVPVIVVITSVVAFFTYRFVNNKKSVDSMLERSMKVQEIPNEFSGWRSSEGTGGMRSVRSGGNRGFLGKLRILRGR